MKNRKTYVIFLFILFLYFSYLMQENYLIYNTKDNKTILFGREEKDYTNIKPILSNNNPLEYVWNHTWGGDYWDDRGKVMAIDSSDNIYVAGTTGSFGAGKEDMYVVKYDKSGNKKWDITWGGEKDDGCVGMVLDSSTNLYLAGNSGDDMCLVKYNSSGIQQWNRTWDGDRNYERCQTIAMDSLENIYVAGQARFGDMYIAKYDKFGNCKWNRTWSKKKFNSVSGIVLDSLNNIYISGNTQTYDTLSADLYLVKYNNSGTHLWNLTWGGTKTEFGSGIIIDSYDNIYVTGITSSFESESWDMFLVKYNKSGRQLWNRTWGGSEGDECSEIALDSSNNIYIGGETGSFGAGWDDMCLVKYNSSGTQLWNRTWGGGNPERCNAIILDSLDNIYIAGGTSSFGQGYFNMPTRIDDMTIVKYNSLGTQQWNCTWGSSDRDTCSEVALDSSNNIYLMGYMDCDLEPDYNYDMCLVKFSSEPQIIINSPSHNEFFKNDAPNFDISIYVVKGDLNTTWYSLDDGITNITLNELIGIIDQAEWNKKGDGRLIIQLHANDTMGNKGYAEMIVRKDTTAPISSILFVPHSGTNIVNISTLFTLTSDDGIGSGVSNINYKINNSDFIEYNEPFNLSGYEFGDYNISYNAIDTLGNIEEINTLLVKIVDIGIIPGYDLVVLFSIIGLISVILIKNRYKVYN